MLRLALLAPAFFVLAALAPLAAAEGEPPCDGQPLVDQRDPVGLVTPQDQVRALGLACTYGGGALVAACADSAEAMAFASYWVGFYFDYFDELRGKNPLPAGGAC